MDKEFWKKLFPLSKETKSYHSIFTLKESFFVPVCSWDEFNINMKVKEGIPAETINSFYQGRFFEKIYEFLIDFYCQGKSINWPEILQDDTSSIISLPNYPFEKKYCWFKENF